MNIIRKVILGLITAQASWAAASGLSSLCSCVNPSGVCAILCMRPGFNNPVMGNRTPAYKVVHPGIMPPKRERRIVYVQRPTLYPARKSMPVVAPNSMNFPLSDEQIDRPACTTATETEYSTVTETHTRVITRKTIRILTTTHILTSKVPVTIEKVKNITRLPKTTTSTETHTKTLMLTKTQTVTSTLPPIIQPVTVKSVKIVTGSTRTATKEVRVPPSIYTRTQTVTTTLPPNPPIKVTFVSTKTRTQTVTVEPSLYKDYVNVQPLPDNSGVVLEFHDSNNKVKRVNVVTRHPNAPNTHAKESAKSLFPQNKLSSSAADSPPDPVQAAAQKRPRSEKPAVYTETAYVTATVQAPVTITRTKNHTKTETTTKTVQPETVIRTISVTLEKPVLITKTRTETSTYTKTEVLEPTRPVSSPLLSPRAKTATVTETQIVPVTISQENTKFITITQQHKVLPTTDKSSQYFQIITELRQQVGEYRQMLEKANETSDSYHSEVKKLRSLLSHATTH
ncbi:uncharacterized protein NEMAJ01_0212 [Nematocida major]|uniref:uncharacterized protein n=1 Tax=Nematocida major TaxID=1912982 RepID=UPI0020079FF8|nr:uncharacterized protein NEMAJ01_0212 [Nematocida major]KAH9385316.1 hypothetical protein NEMAJ01_0212 [Nematocida major]